MNRLIPHPPRGTHESSSHDRPAAFAHCRHPDLRDAKTAQLHRRDLSDRHGADRAVRHRLAQLIAGALKTLSPTIPMMMRAMQVIRIVVTGSWKITIPRI